MRLGFSGWPAVRDRASVLLIVFAVATAASTLCLLALLPHSEVTVHVRWAPDLTVSDRLVLEDAFTLQEGRLVDERTFTYRLANPSTLTIRAIVRHPAVEDTAHLNRRWYRPAFGSDRLRLAAAGGLTSGLALPLLLVILDGVGRLVLRGSQWHRLALVAALIVGASVSVRVWQIPMQVTDSLIPMLQAQQAPGPSPVHFVSERGFLRPLYWTQIRALLGLSGDGHYHAVFKGVQAALVMALFVCVALAARVQTAAGFTGFAFALLVLVGMPTFTGMVSEAYPINHYLEIAVASVAALVLIQGAWRPWKDVAALAVFTAAVLTLESGLLVPVVLVVGWLVGWRGVSRTALTGTVALTAAYFYVRMVYLETGVPDLAERATGFGFGRLEPAETVVRFAGREGVLYAYNFASSVLSVLFSEPRGGQFIALGAWLAGDARPVHAFAVGSSAATTAVIAYLVIARLRERVNVRNLPDDLRMAIVAGAVVLGNALFCIVYVKDEVMSTAGVFYALAAALATRFVITRMSLASWHPVPLAAMVTLLLTMGLVWNGRALSLHYRLYATSVATRVEWADVHAWLEQQRAVPGTDDGRLLVERLRADAARRPVRHARFAPRWVGQWLD